MCWRRASAAFFREARGLMSLADIAGRGTRAMPWGGLAEGVHTASIEVGEKLLVQKVGVKRMIFVCSNNN